MSGKRQEDAACGVSVGADLIRESVDSTATSFAKKFRSYSKRICHPL
jgi:hypothetical protein